LKLNPPIEARLHCLNFIKLLSIRVHVF